MTLRDFVSVINGSEILHIQQYGSNEIIFTGSCQQLRTSENWSYLSELGIHLIIARTFGEQKVYID